MFERLKHITVARIRAKRVIALALIATVALPQGLSAARAAETTRDPNQLLHELLIRIEKRYEVIFAQLPAELANGIDTEKKAELNKAVEEKLAGLKAGTITPAQFRDEIVKANKKELAVQKQELYGQLQNLPTEMLDDVAKAVKGNPTYADSMQEYDAAYTRTEKVNAMATALNADLDHLSSLMAKRTRFVSKDAFVVDLKHSQAIFNARGDNDRKWLKILGFAAIGVAATGLITWGVASAVYGGRYNDRKDQLQQQYDQVKKDLEGHYNALNTQLTNEELGYLGNHGFVSMVCATYTIPDSILCNRYHYQVFSGTKTCTVTCYKNVATGQETLHQSPSCSSPFIPGDCYDPSEYTRGYNDGYNTGYTPGYNDGEHDGYYDGQNDGYDDGYDDGNRRGYNDGYSEGWSDGYAQYQANQHNDDCDNDPDNCDGVTRKLKLVFSRSEPVVSTKSSSSLEQARKKGYEDGFHDGQLMAQ